MKLYCVRHGETLYNAEGRVQGQNECPLSPLGVEQCKRAAEALKSVSFDAIYASPLCRARESARCLADALGLSVTFDDRLKELHAGVFQELRWDELHVHYPDEAARWRSHDAEFRIPNGESRRDLMERSHAVFCDIRERGYNSVLVVAHGGSITAAFKALLDIPPHRSPFVLANASISTALWEKEFRLLTLNDTSHLGQARD